MERVCRPSMSAAEKAEVWRRWKRGESVSDIGRALGRLRKSVHRVVAAHGGVPPRVRTRSRCALTLAEREEISRGLANDCSLRRIACRLGRAPSTVSREVRRHGGRTWDRARRPKLCRLATEAPLRRLVAEKLADDWSPQQIAGWLRRTFPGDPRLHVSHETIYLSLFVQTRGLLKQALIAHLRRRRRMRRSKLASTAGQQRGRIIDAVSIRARPAEAEDRAVPGHWEGDLLSGAQNSHIATLVERQSRFVLLVRLPGKDTTRVVQARARAICALPEGLMVSPDLGPRARTGGAPDVDRRHPGPGLLLRPAESLAARDEREHQWLASTVLPPWHQPGELHAGGSTLNAVAQRLNSRPRTTLGYATPADRLGIAVTPSSVTLGCTGDKRYHAPISRP